MFKILLITSFFCSFSTFAEEPTSGSFSAKGTVESDFLLMSGCRDAKAKAISLANDECFQSGYSICLVVQVKKLDSKLAGIYLASDVSEGNLKTQFVFKHGYCTYEARVLGTNF